MDLDEDIVAALRAFGARARAARSITGLESARSDRATARVTLAGGGVVKARRLSRPAKAERYVNLVRALGHLPMPAILSRTGRVTIEEWVAGRPLSDLALTRKRLHASADILGALHATPRVGRRRLPASGTTRSLVIKTARQIETLAAAGALSGGEARALLVRIRRCAPATAPTGVTHNDFCAENIVEDRHGQLHVVDNGGVRIGFLDFDLARSWYRWPMPAGTWQAFFARYRRWRRPAPAADGTRFWRIAAVVKSARFRVSRGSAAADVPLERLRRLIQDRRG